MDSRAGRRRSTRPALPLPLLLLASALLACRPGAAQLNPCAEQVAELGKGFAIGLAYWPGGAAEDWGRAADGLNPCNQTAASTLADQPVQVALFNLEVDKITTLRTSRKLEAQLFFGQGGGTVMSVVAFAGDVRAEARHTWSEDPEIGSGVIDELTLIAEFDRGKLKSLQWISTVCGGCATCMQTGTVYAGLVIEQCASVAFTTASCSCENAPAPNACANNASQPLACQTSFHVGTSGTDLRGSVLQSGPEIQRNRKFSLTKLYENVAETTGTLINDTNTALQGVADTVTGGS